ncbi:hypothetical protein FK216_03120 [Moraxellaceae bacterium AER2_44_116]|jgi:hypothetical protein|nr:hypothetical protein [Moraxellaceae bacterium]TQC99241.1 hypothetical protein FK216_03120 [Moraxellaceae bacterium AER2_44_116]
MRKSSSIRFVTQVERDLVLLKSVLKTFAHQPNTDWNYQAEGYVDVVLLDMDEHYLSKLEYARSLGRVVVLYAKDVTHLPVNTLVLHKPARARDVLSMLSAAEVSLNALNKQAQAATHVTKVVDNHRPLVVDEHKTAFAY